MCSSTFENALGKLYLRLPKTLLYINLYNIDYQTHVNIYHIILSRYSFYVSIKSINNNKKIVYNIIGTVHVGHAWYSQN